MYNKSISFKVLFLKPPHIKWRYYRQKNFNQLDIKVSYVDIIGLCHNVAIFENLCAALPFQAHANYGTLSVDFGKGIDMYFKKNGICKDFLQLIICIGDP